MTAMFINLLGLMPKYYKTKSYEFNNIIAIFNLTYRLNA